MKDICVRETYQKDGQEKVSWNKIGNLIETANGKQYVKLFIMPGVLLSVFEQNKKETNTKTTEPDESPYNEEDESVGF